MARNGMTKLPKRLISVPARRTQIGGGRARNWSRKVDILSGAKDLTMQSVAESEPLTRPSATVLHVDILYRTAETSFTPRERYRRLRGEGKMPWSEGRVDERKR